MRPGDQRHTDLADGPCRCHFVNKQPNALERWCMSPCRVYYIPFCVMGRGTGAFIFLVAAIRAITQCVRSVSSNHDSEVL